MKKSLLVISLLIAPFFAHAQFEKGKWIINPSLTGMSFSYTQNDHVKAGASGQVGSFVMDNVALMAGMGADWSSEIDEYFVEGGARYYLESTGVYVGAGLDFNRFCFKGGSTQTDWGIGLETGYAFFLSRTVTIEPSVYYKWRFNNSDMSKFGIKLGFGFYF